MSSSTTISSTVTTVLGVLNTTVTSGLIYSETVATTAVGDISPTSAEATPIFLETKAAQGIAGAFVWVALFITCQQVCYNWLSMGKTEGSGLRALRTELLRGGREKDGMWGQEIYN